jgi:hypothetical protein
VLALTLRDLVAHDHGGSVVRQSGDVEHAGHTATAILVEGVAAGSLVLAEVPDREIRWPINRTATNATSGQAITTCRPIG